MSQRVNPTAIALPILTVLMSFAGWGGEGAIGQAQPTPTPSPSSQPSQPLPSSPSTPTPTPSPSPSPQASPEPEAKFLVHDVVIKGAEGQLQEEAYKVIKTRPKKMTTHSQLQEDVNAIFATGYFSNVKPVQEDTPSGVHLTFEVTVNPVLRSVQVEGKRVLPNEVIAKVFSDQYGKVINLNTITKGIKVVNKWYQDRGFVLAQVINSPIISANGVVTLQVAEGEIESIRVRYIDKEGNDKDQQGHLYVAKTPSSVVIKQSRTKPGETFNRREMEQDLKQLFDNLGFDDVRLSLELGETDPRKVIVVFNVTNNDTLERVINLEKRSEGTDEARQKSIAKYQEALQFYLSSKDKITEALILSRLGKVYLSLKDYQQAHSHHQQVLKLSQLLKLPVLEAVTLSNIGNTYYESQDYQQAFESYSKMLKLWQKIEEVPTEDVYGGVVFALGKSSFGERFTEFYFAPEKLIEKDKINKVPKPEGHVNPKDFFVKAIAVARIGELYQLLGDYQQALYWFRAASGLLLNSKSDQTNNKFKDDLPNWVGALSLLFASSIYSDLGDKDAANNYYALAQKNLTPILQQLSKKGNVSPDFLTTLSSILPLFASGEDEKDKTDLFEWISSTLEKIEHGLPDSVQKQKSHQLKLLFLSGLGDAYTNLGENQKAFDYYQKALELKPPKGSKESIVFLQLQTSVLISTGKAQFKLRNYQEAIQFYNQALNIFRNISENNSQQIGLLASLKLRQSDTLNLIGEAYSSLGKYEQAFDSYTRALALVEESVNQSTSPSTLLRNFNMKAEALLGLARIAQLRNDLVLAQTQIEKALSYIETQSSKSFNQPTQTQKLYPFVSAYSRFKVDKKTISYYASNRKYYDFNIDVLLEKYRRHRQEVDKYAALQVSDRYHSLSSLAMSGRSEPLTKFPPVKVLDLQHLQSQLLDNNTVLLEYSLGEEQSHLWVVSRKKIDYYPLKKRTEIEKAAKEYYRYLTEPGLRVRPNTITQKGLALSQLLFPQAIVKHLTQHRLLIVADSWLQYIPFTTLPLPKSGLSLTTPNLAALAQPLIIQYEIISLPSASTLALIRQAQRPTPTKTVAVVANPVFSRSVRRLFLAAQTNSNIKQLAANLNDSSPVESLYPPLPGTYDQAQAILKWVPDPAQRLEKYDFDANLQTITGTEANQALNLGEYKILHFATHGILDTQRPERSGMILSVIDRQGELQRSLLSPSDVLNLNLSAELVVLSGCRTGLGASAKADNPKKQEVQGEGLVGLTGSFMVAGAQRVVASLWSVDDKATTELMKLFYRNVFEKKLSYAAALREAQMEMRANPRWREPYYWAGFIIQGEWR